MDQTNIEKIKRIIAEWNPLGAAASKIPDLNEYETEVDDILFALEMEFDFPKKKVTKSQTKKIVRAVLNEAFNLHLSDSECDEPTDKILKILNGN